jgi:molybdenum cofactor biosynthesis enzyme MoaA
MSTDEAGHRLMRREFLSERRLAILSLLRACDLQCVYCRGEKDDWYDRMAEHAEAKLFPRAAWPRFVALCTENNVAEVLLTGGEPSHYPELIDLIDYFHGEGLRMALHTHGRTKRLPSLLAHLVARQIPFNFHVSTELFDDDQLDLRGVESPLPFVRGASQAGFRVELKIVLHQRLRNRLDELASRLRWWIEQGAASIRFQPVVQTGRPTSTLALQEDFVAVLDALAAIRRDDPLIRSVIRNSDASFEASRSVLLGTPARFDIARRCRIVERILFVTTDFELLNCQTLWSKPETADCTGIFDFVCAGYQL